MASLCYFFNSITSFYNLQQVTFMYQWLRYAIPLSEKQRQVLLYLSYKNLNYTTHELFKVQLFKITQKILWKNVWPLINRPRAVLGASLISMIMLWWLPMSSALVKHAMVIADVIWSVEACYGDCEFYGDHQCHVICRNMLLWSPVPCHVLWQIYKCMIMTMNCLRKVKSLSSLGRNYSLAGKKGP